MGVLLRLGGADTHVVGTYVAVQPHLVKNCGFDNRDSYLGTSNWYCMAVHHYHRRQSKNQISDPDDNYDYDKMNILQKN